MRPPRLAPFALAALLAAGLPAAADEGMWMPQQVPQMSAKLKALGFEGDPQEFADLTGFPMGAIVSLGGCTASFVSPEGLIVTNHHCVQGALQFNSTPQRNLLRDGFLAKTRADELSAGPGARVFVTTSVTDVTAAITGGIDGKTTDRQRYETIERRVKERVAACEKDGSRCLVPSFFEGMKYYEIAQVEIKDLRLVYAPAEGIGNFGGETDNWRWPRHTGDWGFYRAYVGPDGRPATFAAANVPYRPKHFLKISAEGTKEGDLVFVVGYPGRTQRLQTFAEIQEIATWTYPRQVRLAEEQITLLEAIAKDSPELRIKVSGRLRGLNNGLTNQKGKLEGLTRGGALARKEADQKELEAWIAADPARQKAYGDVLPALAALHAEAEKTREGNAALAGLFMSSSYLGAAQTIYRLSVERPKADLAREPGYQQRDWPRIREAQDRLQRTIDPTVDRALLRWAVMQAAALPAGQRIEALDTLVGLKPGLGPAEAGRLVDGWLDGLYKGTRLGDRDARLALLDRSTAEVEAANDSFIALYAALHPRAEANREVARVRSGAYARLRPRYMQAVLEKAGGLVAPDANGTLRITFGQVKGVEARDGLFYAPFTRLQGILEKNTGSGEFDAPKAQLEAIRALRAGKKTAFAPASLGDVPVDFLSTVDTTGGNSGSPTLNGRGELVGLLFDGTYDTVASDLVFDPVKTRSIHVDARYMLWTMSEVDGATHLLSEMGIR